MCNTSTILRVFGLSALQSERVVLSIYVGGGTKQHGQGTTMKKAKKTKTKKGKKVNKGGPSSSRKRATKKAGLSALTGCCTIVYDDKPDEQIEGISKAECTRRARARGGTGQWYKGACA
jgi:hypothetical protein